MLTSFRNTGLFGRLYPRISKFMTALMLMPWFFINETKAWIVYPWEYGEFAAFQYEELKEKMPIKEIRRRLKDIGIPPPLVDAYFSLIEDKLNNERTDNEQRE